MKPRTEAALAADAAAPEAIERLQHPEVTIEKLHPRDERGYECLVQLLTMLHTETPHAPLDLGKLREGIRRVLDTGVVFVSVTPERRLAGSLGLIIDSPWFSREQWLTDHWLFVHPDCRRTPHARMLVRTAKALAEDWKMPLHMAVTGYGGRIAGKIRLFARELGEPNGAIWTVRS